MRGKRPVTTVANGTVPLEHRALLLRPDDDVAVTTSALTPCFTRGRGSVLGCRPTPSIKPATNTEMFARMSEDMDINCGRIVDGTTSIAEVGDEIFETILAVTSGWGCQHPHRPEITAAIAAAPGGAPPTPTPAGSRIAR